MAPLGYNELKIHSHQPSRISPTEGQRWNTQTQYDVSMMPHAVENFLIFDTAWIWGSAINIPDVHISHTVTFVWICIYIVCEISVLIFYRFIDAILILIFDKPLWQDGGGVGGEYIFLWNP